MIKLFKRQICYYVLHFDTWKIYNIVHVLEWHSNLLYTHTQIFWKHKLCSYPTCFKFSISLSTTFSSMDYQLHLLHMGNILLIDALLYLTSYIKNFKICAIQFLPYKVKYNFFNSTKNRPQLWLHLLSPFHGPNVSMSLLRLYIKHKI